VAKQQKPVTWNARAVQYAIAVQLDFFKYCIVPNLHLGGSDEMDLGVLSPSKLLWEVEIKVDMFDWKRDLEKPKHTLWKMKQFYPTSPARFYYAVPWKLVPEDDTGGRKLPAWLPAHAGVIAIGNTRTTKTQEDGTQLIIDKPSASIIRTAKPLHRNQLEQKFVDEMYRKLSIRYWKSAYKNDPGTTFQLPEH
jgi:hypothetical protein